MGETSSSDVTKPDANSMTGRMREKNYQANRQIIDREIRIWRAKEIMIGYEIAGQAVWPCFLVLVLEAQQNGNLDFPL